MTVEEAAEALEVSSRTIYNELKVHYVKEAYFPELWS